MNAAYAAAHDPTEVIPRRVLAYAIDVAIAGVVFVALAGALWTGVRAALASGVAVLLSLLNLVVLQGATGASIGKRITGLRVVDANGNLAGIVPAFIRWLLLVVDGVFIVVGLVVTLVTHPHRRIGDFAAGTYVVGASDVGHRVGETAAPPVAYDHRAYDPLATTATPTPTATAAIASPTATPTPTPSAPVWDAVRGAWVSYDPGRGAWLRYDDANGQWRSL